ncbi:MAG: diguanylate cyclase [Acidobacteria bacterium]|nr:diguanylate cyclase [Acidobacteriota bacterium]
MLNTSDLAVFVLIAGGLVAGGYLIAWRRILTERRRASEAEARAQALWTVLQGLSGTVPTDAAGLKLPVDSVATSASRPGDAALRSQPAADSRYLFVSFEEEILRARERAISLTLLTLSLQNSPDDGAEEPGSGKDRLLRSVAHAVRGQMRGCDTCIRYAANEFILILPGVTRDEARRVEGRLRIALQGISHEVRHGVNFKPRASLGSATFPEDGGSFDQLLTLADSRRLQDSTTALPGMPPPHGSAVRFRVPPPALSRN